MENKITGRPFRPILICFFAVSLLIVAARPLLVGWNTDFKVLLAGNGVLFLVTGISFYLYTKALQNSNVQVFIRMVYGSLLVKMLVCLLATLLYVLLAGPPNRNAIIGCFIWYILYTYLEVRILTQLNKKAPKNA
jgi:hypothetical protein